jgi:serine/threonine-protein kinase
VPLERSAQGLKERAAEVARKFGYDAATDSAYGFSVNNEYLKHIKESDESPRRWDGLKAGRPAGIFFWYRQSPRYLVPFNRGAVTQLDPPRAVSGMASVSLDGSGRMLGFNGTPPQMVEAPNAQPFDWSRAFAEAGLDPSGFKPTEPKWTPQQPFDERAAWEGTHPGRPDSPIRVEAAAFHGKLVSFQIVNPWNRPAREEQAPEGAGERLVQAALVVIFFMILSGAALLARRNLRMGRGDRKGAFRLAGLVFALEMAAWLTAAHHVPELDGEFSLFIEVLAIALLISSMLWLVYIAVEPSVRRRWPGIIISWNRLLAGDYRDPLVGRDLLLGALCGSAYVLLSYLQVLAPQWVGMPATTPLTPSLAGLEGTQYVIPLFISQVVNALVFPAALLLLLLIFSIIFRRWWAAVGALFLLLTVLGSVAGEHPSFDWLGEMLRSALILVVLLRFGLLAAVFAQFFALAFFFFPMTTDFSAWYAGSTAFALAVLVVFTLYGFRTSLAGQRLFSGSLVED